MQQRQLRAVTLGIHDSKSCQLACDDLSGFDLVFGSELEHALEFAYLLFFIHLETRRDWVSPATLQPTGAWVTQQARNFSMWAAEQGLVMAYVVRDRDTKFTTRFDAILESESAQVIKLPARAPNLNAFTERWAQSVQHEALDHFIVVKEGQLDSDGFEARSARAADDSSRITRIPPVNRPLLDQRSPLDFRAPE